MHVCKEESFIFVNSFKDETHSLRSIELLFLFFEQHLKGHISKYRDSNLVRHIGFILSLLKDWTMRHLWGVFGPPPFAHDRFSPNCHFSSQEKRWGQNKPLRKSRETPLRNLKSVGDKINPLLEIREIGFPFMTGELLVCTFVTSPRFHKASRVNLYPCM